MPIKRALGILVVSIALFSSVHGQGTLLIAYWSAGGSMAGVPDSYLDSLQKAGYAYVQVQGDFSTYRDDWRMTSGRPNGFYNWDSTAPRKLYQELKDLFRRANKRNLGVIPQFTLGSAHSETWHLTNANVVYNSIPDDKGKMTPMAPDPDGIDRSFSSLMDVIFRASRDAGLSGRNLDFIHIGHDEMTSGKAVHGSYRFLIGASSPLDKDWLIARSAQTHGYEKANYDLIADEIKRRVTTISGIAKTYGQSTRTITYADMFDPQGNGNPSGNTSVKNPTRFLGWANGDYVGLSTMNVLKTPGMQAIRNQLILCPWQYSRIYGKCYSHPEPDYDTAQSYDAAAALAFFRKSGFKIILGSAFIMHGNGVVEDSKRAMREYIRVSSLPGNPDMVIGHAAFTWTLGWNRSPRLPDWNILRDLANASRRAPKTATTPAGIEPKSAMPRKAPAPVGPWKP